ncbi:type IX secretion system plug protein [Croceiramulus getboli]|nr:DUF5103 domain-containing protein [Flavobacteriaceae bacterium YJPT1-3]
MKFFQSAIWAAVLILGFHFSVWGQVAEEMEAPPYIKTIQFIGNSDFGLLPVIRLGDPLVISFDDIIGDEADYYYTITHHNFDWTPSLLVKSEYLRGFDNLRIRDYQNSSNTLQPYSHYELRIPNAQTEALLQTGNYLLSITNSEGELVFSRKFMIYQPQASVGLRIRRSRDLNFINSKQAVQFRIDPGEQILINPKKNVKTIILKNNNLKNSIIGLEPQFVLGNVLEYRYDQEASFWGGNEFFNFENKDIRAATNMIDYIELESLYHNYLYTNPNRDFQPYTYNPDINGAFVINTLIGDAPELTADYVWIHFSVFSTGLEDGKEVHLYGNFNNYELGEQTRMRYNPQQGIYEKALLLKQGFYNYRYAVTDSQQRLLKNDIDGDFWQTENEYTVLVYYRNPGSRIDELIGVGKGNSTTIRN